MTKSELTALINAYGAENLLTIVFDNSLIINFIDDRKFDMSCIKTVGGVDVLEMKTTSIRSKTSGSYDIPCISIHPIDMIQYLSFSPRDRRNDIDKQTFHNR